MLRHIRRSSVRWLAHLCLTALLLIPVVVGAHHHADLVGSHDCATCVVVHHGPLAAAPALTIDVPHGSIPIVPITVDAPVAFAWVQQLGRAPPFGLLPFTV